MGVYIIEPLFVILAAAIAAGMLSAPRLTAIALGLYVGLRIWRAIVRMERRAEERKYRQAIIALAQQQGSHQP